MSDAMSECMCIEVDVSDLRVATINSFEICAKHGPFPGVLTELFKYGKGRI